MQRLGYYNVDCNRVSLVSESKVILIHDLRAIVLSSYERGSKNIWSLSAFTVGQISEKYTIITPLKTFR